MARVFTVHEAADYLRVTPYTVRKWLRRGRIKGSKIGHIYRILESDLDALLREPGDLLDEGPVPQRVSAFGKHPLPGRTLGDYLRDKHREIEKEERHRQERREA